MDVLTNEAGGIVQKLSYDAFGQRRDSTDWSGAPGSGEWSNIAGITHRGYTEHEGVDNVDLVHMNGRVYDPLLARFTSPDPFVQAPFNGQSLNRYSYTFNNPLSLIDPSGFASGGPMPQTAQEAMYGVPWDQRETERRMREMAEWAMREQILFYLDIESTRALNHSVAGDGAKPLWGGYPAQANVNVQGNGATNAADRLLVAQVAPFVSAFGRVGPVIEPLVRPTPQSPVAQGIQQALRGSQVEPGPGPLAGPKPTAAEVLRNAEALNQNLTPQTRVPSPLPRLGGMTEQPSPLPTTKIGHFFQILKNALETLNELGGPMSTPVLVPNPASVVPMTWEQCYQSASGCA